MGANAQTSVPLFVANSVLTAAQQNISAATGVPVFATTATRDAAFGGSNKALAEGQLCYLEATDVVQYYTGSAWATVGPSTGGLVCVKAETAFTTAATVTADGIFTSSYTNYLLQFTSTCATNQNITLQLRASGVTATAANYNDQSINASSTTVTAARSASATSFDIQTSSASSLYNYTQVTFFQPQLARATGFGALSTYNASASYAQPVRQDWFGNHTVATAYDGFIISVSGGETLTGSYSVYGYSKTV